MQCKNSGCQETLVERGSKLVCPKCGFSIQKATAQAVYGSEPSGPDSAEKADDKFLDWKKSRYEPRF